MELFLSFIIISVIHYVIHADILLLLFLYRNSYAVVLNERKQLVGTTIFMSSQSFSQHITINLQYNSIKII